MKDLKTVNKVSTKIFRFLLMMWDDKEKCVSHEAGLVILYEIVGVRKILDPCCDTDSKK